MALKPHACQCPPWNKRALLVAGSFLCTLGVWGPRQVVRAKPRAECEHSAVLSAFCALGVRLHSPRRERCAWL